VKGINSSYRNSKLFSRDFLEDHLPKLPEWQIHKDELKAAMEKLQSLFEQALPATSEASLEEELIRPILADVLGFSYLVQPSAVIFKTHRQPDYALFASEEEKQGAKAFDGDKRLFESALAVADAKAWDVDLDAVGPASQMHDYVLISGLRWGILTNGRRWRLTHRDTVHELDTFFEIDLEELLKADDPASLKYFLLFFRAESFRAGGFLDRVLTQSVEYAQRVGAELKENVYEALRCLCQGFLGGNAEFSPEDLSTIHQNALIVLYRILFLLYAESERERELLPLSNTDYQERIGLCALKRDVADQRNWLAETHSLWSRLSDLFRLINRGSESLGIYAYNGGLFDPQLHRLLERWQIGDRYLAEALRLLACTDVEGRRGFLDYSALDVRELGSIYEGLLEHKLIQKNGALEWEKDRSQRKKTGSYYTPEYIVQYIVEQTISPLIDEIQSGLKANLDELTEKIRHARGENRRLLEQQRDGLFKKARERVLNLKVLDPAMGSGHFLVSTCDYLARRMAELEAELAGEETEEAVQALKRTVAERCLYGVDLNPLATELAKLSLWLHTVAKGKPLSFLDHHLRTGNSLIGARVSDLERPPSGKAHEIGLWESKLVQDLSKAIGYLNFIKTSASASRSDIEEKKQRWELINAWIGKYKRAADVWLSSYFGNTVSDKDFQQVLQAAASSHMDEVADSPALRQAREIASEKRFFHWELEFPDVFFDRFGRPLENPGFDAVIGNPPWVAVDNLASEDKSFYSRTYGTAQKFDLSHVFGALGVRVLRSDGILSFVIPEHSWIGEFHTTFRSLLFEKTQLLWVGSLKEGDFSDVSNPASFFGARKNESLKQGYKFTVLNCRCAEKLIIIGTHEMGFDELNADVILNNQNQPVCLSRVFFNPRFLRIRAAVQQAATAYLDNFAVVSDGVKTADALSEIMLLQPHKKPDTKRYAEALRSGKSIPCRFGSVLWDGWWILREDQVQAFKSRSGFSYGSPRRMYCFTKEQKIIMRQTEPTIVATLDISQYRFPNSIFAVALKENVRLQDLFLLAMLNSRLIRQYYLLSSQVGSTTKPQLYINQLKTLPIRRIAFVTAKAKRARLVEEGKRLYQGFLETKDPAPILDLVKRCLPKDDKGNFIQEKEKSDVVHDLLAYLAEQMIELNKQKQKEIQGFLKWIEREWEINIEDLALKTKLKGYHEHDFDEMLRIAKRNKKLIKPDPESREFQERLEREWKASMEKLRPLKEKMRLTDDLIDQIVYRLYGLTEEEIEIVEGI